MIEDEEQYLSDLTIKSISISGFRDCQSEINVEVGRAVNFLIGKNGTGKTTLINIIADTLACRYHSLMSAPFTSIRITFQHRDNRYKPFLTVQKEYDEDGDVIQMRFEFTDFKTKGPAFAHHLKSRYYLRNEDIANSSAQRRVRSELSKRFRLTWLALNRVHGISKPATESSSDLDFRLEHSLQRLGTYLTRLDSKFAEELQKFQQEWFMSLLVSSRRTDAAQQVSSLDLEEEGRQIREMLAGIGISEAQYSSKVDRHIATAKKIGERSYRPPKNDLLGYIADLYDISRLHHWVEQWQDLQQTKTAIYKPKEKFLQIANDMLFNKDVAVDSGNKIYIKKRSKSESPMAPAELRRYRRELASGRISRIDEIRLADLSSGEKQLLIFLAETVLQANTTHIFIADEPELSLHIEWQEKLVPVILELNPKSQIFFATHSPDIVSTYRENVVSMEELVA